MRLIAAILTCGALALAALAGQELWLLLTAAPQKDTGVQIAAVSQSDAPRPPQKQAHRWPALFGERQPPKPTAAATPQAAPQPPKAAKPPIESLGYVLKGRVQAGPATWAIVSHPSGEQLVRQGDALRAGITIARIDAKGLWISREGDAPELLEFTQ